jgi:hypothetical protein
MPEPIRSKPTPTSLDPHAARTRRLQSLCIGAILAFQVLTPLSYYLGVRGRYDERFSWRMFSTLRLRDCKVLVTEELRSGGTRPVNVERDVHVAWLRLLERMRGAVVDAYLARRCQLGAGELTRVAFECSCHDTDGQELPPMQQALECEQ